MSPVADRYNLIAFLSIIIAIVVLTFAAVAVQMFAPDEHAAKALTAIATMGASITGLIGIAGTFKPRSGGEEQAGRNLATALGKMPEPEANGTAPGSTNVEEATINAENATITGGGT